ncbi:unnamed protein product [[Actinomadura] parvosata subsp. kistnae]|nr:unnamed protein product [Actinomadura parvosata subsp. kistnae]
MRRHLEALAGDMTGRRRLTAPGGGSVRGCPGGPGGEGGRRRPKGAGG